MIERGAAAEFRFNSAAVLFHDGLPAGCRRLQLRPPAFLIEDNDAR